jgi:hypothetical protein
MVVPIAIRPVVGPVVSIVRPVGAIAIVWPIAIAIVRLVAIAIIRLVAIAVAVAIGRSWGSCGNCETHA